VTRARDPRQLAMLRELSEDRCETAGKRLAHATALHRDSAARLTLLERYRGEYRVRLANGSALGVAPAELRNFREFLEKLEQALAQQRAEMETLARGVEECRKRWLGERRREQSFGVLAQRAVTVEREREARNAQKQTDEFSARKAR
jgi:flagellar FliJ protein